MLWRHLSRRRWWLAYAVFSFFVWQIFCWRYEAPRITWLQIKSIVKGLPAVEWMEWGARCNTLGDYGCAARSFSRAVEVDPSLRLALANLGVAEAKRHKCQAALRALDSYRSVSHENPDVLYWRGVCLMEQGDYEAARTSLYFALSFGADATESAEVLIDLLEKQGLFEEALSVLAGVSQGRPSENPRWRSLFSKVIARTPPPESSKRIIRLPSVDGQRFWAPVKFTAATEVEFATVDLEQADSSLSPSHQRIVGREPATTINLTDWQIGPWVLSNVQFSSCTDCDSTIGRALLDRFEVSEDVEAGIRFLILSPL